MDDDLPYGEPRQLLYFSKVVDDCLNLLSQSRRLCDRALPTGTIFATMVLSKAYTKMLDRMAATTRNHCEKA